MALPKEYVCIDCDKKHKILYCSYCDAEVCPNDTESDPIIIVCTGCESQVATVHTECWFECAICTQMFCQGCRVVEDELDYHRDSYETGPKCSECYERVTRKS